MKFTDLTEIDKMTNPNNVLNINFNTISTNYLIDYIHTINSNNQMQHLYVNSTSKININLIDFDRSVYLFMIVSIYNSVNKIMINSKYLHLFEPINEWNICVCENIMFDLPFTIKNYIYLPLNYLKKCSIENNTTDFEKTLIHEKIHINQRANIDMWNKLVEKIFRDKWIIITQTNNNKLWNFILKEIDRLSKLNLYTFISNPDIDYDNFKYIYKINTKLYYANYVYSNHTHNITIKYFYVNIVKNIFEEVKNIFDHQDHPFETFAYDLSDLICKQI